MIVITQNQLVSIIEQCTTISELTKVQAYIVDHKPFYSQSTYTLITSYINVKASKNFITKPT